MTHAATLNRRPLSLRKKLLFTLIIVVGLPILVELACRVAFGWNRHWLDCHRPHETLGWCLREGWAGKWGWTGGYARINAQGLRQDEDLGPKAPAEKRLLVLGDSVTFGANVKTSETYPEQLQGLLRQQRHPWRILNAGVTAYDASQEADWLETFGWELQPDALAVAFCRNDTSVSIRDRGPVGTRLGQWLTEHSIVCFRVERLYARCRAAWKGSSVEGTPLVQKQDLIYGWPLVDKAYRQIAASAKARGVPVVLFIWPTLDFLEERETEDLASKLNQLAVELGWQVIDLEPAFRPTEARMFLDGDPIHPSAYGYARAAERLAQELPCLPWFYSPQVQETAITKSSPSGR